MSHGEVELGSFEPPCFVTPGIWNRSKAHRLALMEGITYRGLRAKQINPLTGGVTKQGGFERLSLNLKK